MNAEKRPVGRPSKSAGEHDNNQSTPERTRTERLVEELVAGRWPGDEMPGLAVEQIVVSGVIRHPDDRAPVASLLPPSVFRDGHCRSIYEAVLEVDPGALNQHAEVAAHLRAAGVPSTELDLILDGGPVVFLAAGYWRRAVHELIRRTAVDRVLEAVTAAAASLAAGADPQMVAERLARRVVA